MRKFDNPNTKSIFFQSKFFKPAGLKPLAGQFWPTSRMFDTPALKTSCEVCVYLASYYLYSLYVYMCMNPYIYILQIFIYICMDIYLFVTTRHWTVVFSLVRPTSQIISVYLQYKWSVIDRENLMIENPHRVSRRTWPSWAHVALERVPHYIGNWASVPWQHDYTVTPHNRSHTNDCGR